MGNEILYKSLLSLDKSFVPDDFEMCFLYNNDGVSENSILDSIRMIFKYWYMIKEIQVQ